MINLFFDSQAPVIPHHQPSKPGQFSATHPPNFLPILLAPCIIGPVASHEGGVSQDDPHILMLLFLAPTGALIVLMFYYSIRSARRRPLFEISSISAIIFSFSF